METPSLESWLQKIKHELKPIDYETITQVITLVQLVSNSKPAAITPSYLTQGLMAADILHQLNLDGPTLAAAILHCSFHTTGLTLEDIKEHLGDEIAKLIRGTEQMASISELHQNMLHSSNYQHNVDNIRKMLLAMVDDIRVVLIKIAEHLSILRSANVLADSLKRKLATETMAIYAPLTNRLGIAQLKWELEDLSFRYLEPEKYEEIESSLKQRFPEYREYLKKAVTTLEELLANSEVKNFQVTGRTKHIYSIYRKMIRKKTGLDGIYDVSALRIFVPTIVDCYTVLSLVHNTWQYIPTEFDDYIAAPKPNGYRSIHTAVYGPQNRIIEIQIRSYDMHRQAELGIAAHWVYKEGKSDSSHQTSNNLYHAKLAWLREVMDWQQEITNAQKIPINLQQVFNEYVYVFTPEGDLLELPQGATPLDFAYHLHSELGHRSAGAKINNNIVPLTYTLKTGDNVKILTTKDGHPSRDWLIPSLGFLHTSRARSKVLHWFRKQNQEHKVMQGQELLNKETKRLNLNKLDLKIAADKLHFKNPNDLLAALGSGDLKFNSLLNALNLGVEKTTPESSIDLTLVKSLKGHHTPDINIQGVGNLLVYTASCCKPIPDEKIIGYITHGRGVSIHRTNCLNALHTQKFHPERFIVVSWNKKTENKYPVDIIVKAFNRPGLVRDITNAIADAELSVLGLNFTVDKKEQIATIRITVEISGLQPLSNILVKISKLPNIIEVYRSD